MKVYYGTPKGVWVYIDGKKLTTEQATNELLIKGRLLIPEVDKDKNKPVGLFSSTGGFNIVNIEAQQTGEILLLYGEREYVAPIDYETITPEDLKDHLESRINELKGHIKTVAIGIKCFRDSPLD
ncbi:MAG: hypothetical protein MUO26_09905 [Methanotrichaceae archaeon]|nr:hypothetical protein [Methanotrichaceae archaeon]